MSKIHMFKRNEIKPSVDIFLFMIQVDTQEIHFRSVNSQGTSNQGPGSQGNKEATFACGCKE